MRVPGELVVDMEKDTRSLIVTPELGHALPNLEAAFEFADRQYEHDPPAYLSRMRSSVFALSRNGHEAPCSLIYDGETAKAGSILVMFAPFSDGAPETTPARLLDFIAKDEAGLRDKEHAKPNSWNQTTKSAVVHDVLRGLGHGMPVATIYSPVPPHVYGPEERRRIRTGDISPVGEIAELAIEHAQDVLHGPYSETQITDVHTHGASLGDNAIGAASVITRGDPDHRIKSVTAQELILMNGNLLHLADRYMFRQMTGEPSGLEIPAATPRIDEPAVRRDIDKHGSEPTTYWRLAKAIGKLSYLIGLTKPEWLSRQIRFLADEGVALTVANAVNSHVSHETASFLPLDHDNLDYISIQGLRDQKVGHLADEHVALVAGVIALGVSKSLEA
jgi:hypothetical protein